ncbi:hypothetical protein ABBQ32_004616 [Trebouxia sp. C0010 RCD-2024]
MYGGRPQLPPEVWRLRAEHLHQVLKPSYEKEQGKRPLSAAQMLLLDNTRTQMRCALELAAQGDQAAARFALLKLLDENEEVLLHVFGGTLPLTYELGGLQPAHMDAVHLQAAVSQADQLLKAVPNHMVGRLSRALLHICKKDNAAALALLTLVPRQLGTLGLLKGMAAITEALSKVDAQVDKAAVALLSSREAAAKSLVSSASDSCTDHAWANLAEVRTKLLLDQAAATQKMKVPQASRVSLQAAGCFQAGLMSQTIDVCEAWLQRAPAHELHLWAYVLAFFARVNLADEPEQLRKVADDLAVVLEDAKEHSSIQLEGHAFAGVPLQVAQYIVFIEQLLTRVHRIADSLELAARQEKEAAHVNNESSLVLLLKANLETCTKMLTSEDKGLSLASSAKMLLFRARCYLQQRELSLALTDLAYAFALQPCSFEVVSVWGRVLKKREALEEWKRITLLWLSPADSRKLAAEGQLSLRVPAAVQQQARGSLEVPLREHKCKLLAGAFGKHIGLPIHQVLLLMNYAIEAQSLMMTTNREAHRAAQAGPALQPAAFPTWELALSFIPVIPPAPMPHTAPLGARQKAYTGSAASPQGTGSGYSRQGQRPFSRRGTAGAQSSSAPQRNFSSSPSDEAHRTAAGAQSSKAPNFAQAGSSSTCAAPETEDDSKAGGHTAPNIPFPDLFGSGSPFGAALGASFDSHARPSEGAAQPLPEAFVRFFETGRTASGAPSATFCPAAKGTSFSFQANFPLPEGCPSLFKSAGTTAGAPFTAPPSVTTSHFQATPQAPPDADTSRASSTKAPPPTIPAALDWAAPPSYSPAGQAVPQPNASKASAQADPGLGNAAAFHVPSAGSGGQSGSNPFGNTFGGMGKAKGADGKPVVNLTASAGQEPAEPQQRADDATEGASDAAANRPGSAAAGLSKSAAPPAQSPAAGSSRRQAKDGRASEWEVPAFIAAMSAGATPDGAATHSSQQSFSPFSFGSHGSPTSQSTAPGPTPFSLPPFTLSGRPTGSPLGSAPLQDAPTPAKLSFGQQSSKPPAASMFGQQTPFPAATSWLGQQTTAPAASQSFGQQTTAPAASQSFGQQTTAASGPTAFGLHDARSDQAGPPEHAARPLAFGQQAPPFASTAQHVQEPLQFSFGQGFGSTAKSER